MKALVTGSTGFLGRHFAVALRRRGWDVLGVDNAGAPDRFADARDFFRYSPHHFDLAIHCAAVVGGRETIERNPLALAVNLELDAALFSWAARRQPGRVVYISSSAVYPVALQGRAAQACRASLAEDDMYLDYPRLPDELYGWAKLTGEMLAAKARAAGVPVTVIRPFSGYGEDQAESYPFRAICERAAHREDPLTVWGDGQQVRDFIHVDDIVAATLAMVDTGMDGPVNLGTGIPTTMIDLAALAAKVAGYEPEITTVPSKPSGVAYRVADVTRLNEFYRPQVSLEEGVRRALTPLPV